jgi:hypothetical protein
MDSGIPGTFDDPDTTKEDDSGFYKLDDDDELPF